MSPEKRLQSAREAFSAAWTLYVKYINGPKDSGTYWDNLVAETTEAADRIGTPLAGALMQDVIAECNRLDC